MEENLHLSSIDGSPDGIDIVTVSPREIIHSLTARCLKTLFDGADCQANIRLPAMTETRWPKIVVQLRDLVPPAPQKVSDPIIRDKTSKLLYRAHRLPILRLFTKQTGF